MRIKLISIMVVSTLLTGCGKRGSTLTQQQQKNVDDASFIVRVQIDMTEPAQPDISGNEFRYEKMRLRIQRLLKGQLETDYLYKSSLRFPSSDFEDYRTGKELIIFFNEFEERDDGIYILAPHSTATERGNDPFDIYEKEIADYLKQKKTNKTSI